MDGAEFVPGGVVLEPLSHPTSAKQATSANNESIFIVMCISILFMFAYSCLGRLALGVEFTKWATVGKDYFRAFFAGSEKCYRQSHSRTAALRNSLRPVPFPFRLAGGGMSGGHWAGGVRHGSGDRPFLVLGLAKNEKVNQSAAVSNQAVIV